MSGEIKPVKDLARKVKTLTLQRAQRILEHPEDYDAKLYNDTYLTVLKSAVPRSQEITGEDGGSLTISFDPAFKKNDPTPETSGDSGVTSQV